MQLYLPSFKKVALLACTIACSFFCNAAIRYVNIGNLTPAAPYTTWATAGNDLQAVINQCVAGDEIWVVAGIYIPNRRADATGTITINDRDNAFVLKNGVRIFGGFTGVETATTQRNFALNMTILSGNLGTLGTTTDNSYHVVVCAGTVSGTSLNGFFIHYGNANGSGNITVNAVSIGRGSGAGMRINSSSPTISNCVFSANSTTNNGGGMVCDNASPGITNCVFSGNTANDGAGMLNTNASATELVNCTFSGNNAVTTGGAIRNGNASSPLISNCLIWGNLAAGVASAIFNADAGSVPDVNYSLIEGGYLGAANVNADPLFVSPVAATLAPTLTGNYRVQKCSPVLNGGLDSYIPGGINNDLDFNPRINYGKVDMGAYEKQLAVPDASGIVFVDYTKTGDGSSWGNAVAELADAMVAAKSDNNIQQIWVAKGTYYPKYTANFLPQLSCSNTNRTNSFVLVNNVKIFGGFAGGETDTVGRDFVINETILNGDIGVLNQKNDNCAHVVIASGSVGLAELNGFTVKNGTGVNSNATQIINGNPVPVYCGAGIMCFASSPIITNCNISNNEALFVNFGNGAGCWIGPGSQPEISRCFFQNNTASESGGAIFVSSVLNTTIKDCSIYNNTAITNGGGGIYVAGSCRATIRNCYFDGGQSNYGAGILNSVGSIVSIVKCSFQVNNATFGAGIHNNSSNPIIDSCLFEYNSAGQGGAISNYLANPFIKNSSFSYNISIVRGGAIFSENHSKSTLFKCNFYRNTSDLGAGILIEDNSDTNIDSCSFLYNSARSGGAIFSSASTVTINSTEFISNSSIQEGGAILNINNLSNFSSIATDCKFLGNTAGVRGGAVFYSVIANASLYERCVFDSNRCTSSISEGGAFYSVNSKNKFKDCIFRGNQAERESTMRLANSNSEFTNCLFSGNKSNTDKPVIYFNASNGLFSNCTISGNKMVAGTINSVFSGESLCVLTINNSIIWGNEGTLPGASPINTVALMTTAKYSLIEAGLAGIGNININPLFLNPIAASSAPAVIGNYRVKTCSPAVNAGSNALIPGGITTDLDSLSRIKFTTVDMGAYEKRLPLPDANGIVYVDSSNTLNEGNGSSWASAATELADALKAAITDTDIEQIWVAKGTYKPLYLSTDNGTTLSCSLSNRDNAFVLRPDVKLFGGFAGGETDTTARDLITNQTTLSGDIGVAANNTDNTYHVLIASGAAGNAGIDGFSITKGNADANSNYTLNGNIVYRDYGGGIYLHSSSPFVSQCRFTSNYALDNGGALAALNSSAHFSNNLFSSNTAGKKGGAVSLQNCTSTISNTIFSANVVNGPGPNNLAGGLYAENTALNIYNSSFISNSVLNGDGGGAVNELSAGSVFSSCIFSGNTASNRVGGYYNLSSIVGLNNSIFSGNTSGTGGGAGVYNSLGASMTITNSTISGNNTTGNGGGLLTASPCTVSNTIIHNNTATISSHNIYSVFVTPTVNNSIIQGGFAGTGNYNTDPLFVAPASPASAPTILGDYHLQPCSPALNIGNNADVSGSEDLDGNPRIVYSDVDLGAYEQQTNIYADGKYTTWKGIDNDWHNKINWCGGIIPTSEIDVSIPATSNDPVLSTAGETKNIVLENATSITTSVNGQLTINGRYTNNGSEIANNGSWIMAGDSTGQTFPGTAATVTAMNNLEINNSSGITIDKSFAITGVLTPTAGDINLNNDTITLRSTAAATASVAIIQPAASISYTGTGQFEVERFINTGTIAGNGEHAKSWQLLATPVSGQTIFQSWQEAGLVPAGYGTWLTGTGTGFDVTTVGPSMKYFNVVGNTYTGVANTASPLQNPIGYFLFVRGDRTVTTYNGTPNNTTMRSKGIIFSPANPPPSVTVTANKFQSFGNPYPSRIEFSKVLAGSTGINDVFYAWDPKLSTLGGWQTITGLTGYLPTPGNIPGSYYPAGDAVPFIESGQAVFVHGDALGGMVNFSEDCKAGGNRLVNRTANNRSAISNPQYLSTSLFTAAGLLADGNIVVFDDALYNGFDNNDVIKRMNDGENFGLVTQDSVLAVEARSLITAKDTIFFYMKNLQKQGYQLRLAPVNIVSMADAFLIDKFSNSSTQLSLTDSSFVDIVITNDPLSSQFDRFMIVFKMPTVVPVTFTDISATRYSERLIDVLWKVENEIAINRYEIERSTDGRGFVKIGTSNPTANNGGSTSYIHHDEHPLDQDNFYRIKSVNESGSIQYSRIVKVSSFKSLPGIIAYPNPVVDGKIYLHFNDIPPSSYVIKITNDLGQLVFKKEFEHVANQNIQLVNTNKNFAHGNYRLEIFITGELMIIQSLIF